MALRSQNDRDKRESREEEDGSSFWKRLADVKLGSLIDPAEVGERLSLKPFTISKELAGILVGQLERGKADIVAMFAREFKRFLDATDISEEIRKVLSEMTVEVKAEINFKRREKSGESAAPARKSR